MYMNQKKIAVLFGGCSPEYKVSLESACGVLSHLNTQKYQTVMIGITPAGDWYHYTGPIDRIRDDSWQDPDLCKPLGLCLAGQSRGFVLLENESTCPLPVDVVFPVLHGKNGEDGRVQGMLALTGLPVIGCGVLASALCMDKDLAHRLAHQAGISVPAGGIIRQNNRSHDLEKLLGKLTYPLYVKPVAAGSSFGITRVTRPEELESALNSAFLYGEEALVEEEIPGFEVGCAILGNEHLTVGRVDEIELDGGFFDFTEKYTLKTSKIHMPARISSDAEERIRQAAVTVYRALGCSGLARVDLFYTPQGKIVFNEVNTLPGFTAHSRYPSMMKGIGISFSEILDSLIDLAI